MSRKHLVLVCFRSAVRNPRQRLATAPRPQWRPAVFQRWADLVKLLERGKFDLAFFADFVGVDADNIRGGGRRPRGTASSRSP